MALSLFRFIAALGRTQVVANSFGTFALLVIFVLGGFIVAKGWYFLLLDYCYVLVYYLIGYMNQEQSSRVYLFIYFKEKEYHTKPERYLQGYNEKNTITTILGTEHPLRWQCNCIMFAIKFIIYLSLSACR